MKKIFTTSILFAFAVIVNAQSIELLQGNTVVTGTTITVPIAPLDMEEHHIDIKNKSASSINYLVQRIIMTPNYDSTCMVYFCTGINCYAPSANIIFNEPSSGNALAAGASVTGANGLIAHFDVGASCCDTYIKYKVYNTLMPNDTAEITFHYECTTGINENKLAGSMSAAYPNPSNDIVSFKYNVTEFSNNAKIVMFDMLGKTVKEIALTDANGVAKIDVKEFNAGIYFYSLFVDNKAVVSRKLIVSSK